MVTTPKYELIQDRLGRSLTEQLLAWHAAGVSGPAMARLLTMETRVPISGEAVRKWIRRLDEAAA